MSKQEIKVRDFFSVDGAIKEGEDFYSIAGLNENATPEEIKRAYKKLALRLHPDKNLASPEEARKIFQKMSDAYTDLFKPTPNVQPNTFSTDDVRAQYQRERSQEERRRQEDLRSRRETARREEQLRQQEARKERLNLQQEKIFAQVARKILPIINPTKANIPINSENKYQEVGEIRFVSEGNTDSNLTPEEDKVFFNALKFVKNFLEKKLPQDAAVIQNEPKVETSATITTRVSNRFIKQFVAIVPNEESLDEALDIFKKLQNLIYYRQQEGGEQNPFPDITFDAGTDEAAIHFFDEHQNDVLNAVQSHHHQQNISQNIEFLYSNVRCNNLIKVKNNLQFLSSEGKSHQDIQQGRISLLADAAAADSSLVIVKYLTEEAKFDPLENSISDGKVTNALLEAAQHSTFAVFKYFYGKFRDAGQDPLQQIAPNSETLLHKVIKTAKPPNLYPGTQVVFGEEDFEQRLQVIKFIVEQGASLEAKDENGQTPAQLTTSLAILRTIEQATLQKNSGTKSSSGNISVSSSDGESAGWIARLFSPAWTNRKKVDKVYCDSNDNSNPEPFTSANQASKLASQTNEKFR